MVMDGSVICRASSAGCGAGVWGCACTSSAAAAAACCSACCAARRERHQRGTITKIPKHTPSVKHARTITTIGTVMACPGKKYNIASCRLPMAKANNRKKWLPSTAARRMFSCAFFNRTFDATHAPASICAHYRGADPAEPGFAAVAADACTLSTASRKALPGLKCGTRFSGICTASPLRGLRPVRAGRWLMVKLPKPRISIR